jgi:hypothetical protein
VVLSAVYDWMLRHLAEQAAEAHAAERAKAARKATGTAAPLTPDQAALLAAVRAAAAPAATMPRAALIRHLAAAGWFRPGEIRPAEAQRNARSRACPAEHPVTRAGQTRLHQRLEALRRHGLIDFDRDTVRVPEAPPARRC